MEDDAAKPPEPQRKPLGQRWKALLDQLAATHPLKERSDDWLCFAWPDNPRQTVQVKLLSVDDRMRILITADICRGDLVSHTDALELGAKLLVGGVILYKGVVSVRHVFSAEADDASQAPITLSPQARSTRLLEETIVSLRNDAIRIRNILLQRQSERIASYYKVD